MNLQIETERFYQEREEEEERSASVTAEYGTTPLLGLC